MQEYDKLTSVSEVQKRKKKKDVLVSILCVQITVQVPKIGVLALETVRGG